MLVSGRLTKSSIFGEKENDISNNRLYKSSIFSNGFSTPSLNVILQEQKNYLSSLLNILNTAFKNKDDEAIKNLFKKNFSEKLFRNDINFLKDFNLNKLSEFINLLIILTDGKFEDKSVFLEDKSYFLNQEILNELTTHYKEKYQNKVNNYDNFIFSIERVEKSLEKYKNLKDSEIIKDKLIFIKNLILENKININLNEEIISKLSNFIGNLDIKSLEELLEIIYIENPHLSKFKILALTII